MLWLYASDDDDDAVDVDRQKYADRCWQFGTPIRWRLSGQWAESGISQGLGHVFAGKKQLTEGLGMLRLGKYHSS